MKHVKEAMPHVKDNGNRLPQDYEAIASLNFAGWSDWN